MAEIYQFSGVTKVDLDPDLVLEAAKGQMDLVFVIGMDKDGREYFAGSSGSIERGVFMAELFKRRLLEMYEDGE